MKALILSCNNGSGHNTAARALQECFSQQGIECIVRDGVSFLSPVLSRLSSQMHTFVYCHAPAVFDRGWRRAEENPDLFREHSPARSFLERGRFSLGKYIQAGGFDLVLCTHVFPAIILTAARREYALPIRTGIVETDYGNTPGGEKNDMDLHFLPDASLIPGLCAAGVPAEKIVASGIPVMGVMYVCREKKAAKEAFSLNPRKPHLLIMSGSMGSGPIPEMVEQLWKKLGRTVQITVLCGSNTRMQKRLLDRYGNDADIRIYDFVPDMSLLYDSADLLLTKPGGISTTEAAIKGLPMVLFNAVGGCETDNLEFFLAKGGARSGEGVDELCSCCGALLGDRAALEAMGAALRDLFPQNAAEMICKAMLDL